MTWTMTFLFAVRLIWGEPVVGAKAYCPWQTEGRYEDCETHRCVAKCVVTAVGPAPERTVTMRRVRR